MIEELLRLLFWSVMEVFFFRVGQMYLKIFSLGRISIDRERPATVFFVALFGIGVTVALVVLVVAVF